MADTKGEVIRKIARILEEPGKPTTDERIREAIARDYNEYVADAFNPAEASPDISRPEMDGIAEFLMTHDFE